MYARTTAKTQTALLGLAFLAAATAQAAPPQCVARSAPTVTPVVELYTSEGCSSCPAADQWLSRLNPGTDVVALAFHVDYWDRLGWKDRFANAAYTQRQSEQQASNGARFVYTPQVVLDGVDRKDWPGAKTTGARARSTVNVTLEREGTHFKATVAALPDAPQRLKAYWAVTEQGHVTAVQAGENSGARSSTNMWCATTAQLPLGQPRQPTPLNCSLT